VIDPAAIARLAAVADTRTISSSDLDALAPLFDAIATLDREDEARVAELHTRLTAAVLTAAADALCEGAASPAAVSARFFRLRDLLRTREAIAGQAR
jgi:hypothetical protein